MLFDNSKRINKQPQSSEQEVKRGRGRPPKAASASQATPEAPAAAPATPAPTAGSEPKRGRGRPRKNPEVVTESSAEPKRGRGRPRKNPTPAAAPVAAPEPPRVAPVEKPVAAEQPRRGRGRPRKSPEAAPEIPDTPKRGRGRPRKNAASVSTEAAPEPIVAEADAQEPRRGRGRPRKQQQAPVAEEAGRRRPAAKAVESDPVDFRATMTVELTDTEDIPMPVFRARGERAEQKPKEPAPDFSSMAEEAGVEAPRFRDRRDRADREPREDRPERGARPERESRRRDDQPAREPRQERRRDNRRVDSEPEAPAPAPVKPEPIPAPMREVVRIPSDAPQVVMRDGVPTLVRNGVTYPPLFFFGNASDERRLATVLEQVRYAYDSGIRVFVHYVELDVTPSGSADDAAQFAAYLLKQTLDVAPDAQVIFRTVFTAATGWEAAYPKAKYFAESGGLGEPSICDTAFWDDAERCLEDFIGQLRLLPMAEHIMGLHLERGEWFFAAGWGYDTSAAAQEEFRKWVRLRYRNDNVALCASWFDGQAQFDTLTVPDYRGETKTGEEFVQTGRKTRRWVDYHLFLSDVTMERVGQLAHAVKKASEGTFLVGVSYGYTFEWSHPASGHLSLGKLLRTPEVDFIAGPPSYKNREPGGSCPFPGPIDSFALNGKLYVSEEDFKTPISGGHEPDDFNPAMKTPQSLETVHWRGVGAALAHVSGMCWMDLWGNGWLKSPGIWDRAQQVRTALLNRMAAPVSDPDVAVFIDERSLAYLVDQRAFTLLVQNVRESVLRSGLSVGFYLLSDLAHREQFPEAKLYVFMNAWDIRPEVRSAIKTRLQRDNKVLFWLYAAGLFDGGRDAMERVREVTGIALKRQPFASKSGTTIVHKKHPLCESLPERMLSHASELEPSYFAIPEDGIVLGEYSATGLPSFVLRDFSGEGPNSKWRSVFLGEPVVTPGLFRALGQMAGAHVWNFHEDLVHARLPFVAVHCQGAGSRTLALPDKAVAYSLQKQDWVAIEGAQLRFSAQDGQTQAYLVGLRSEIEAILNTPTDQLLKMDAIPERPENTLRLEDVHFDVPIMKVDAWVEEGWSEEMAGDLMFKPSQMEENMLDPESTEEANNSGRRDRRRGRRRGKSRNGDRKSGGGASDFDITEMSVVFRKRE